MTTDSIHPCPDDTTTARPWLPPLYFQNKFDYNDDNNKNNKDQNNVAFNDTVHDHDNTTTTTTTTTTTPSPVNLRQLPSELVTSCLQFCTWGDLARLAVTQRAFQHVLYDAASSSSSSSPTTTNTPTTTQWQLAMALLHGTHGLARNTKMAVQLLQQMAAVPVDPWTRQPILLEHVHFDDNDSDINNVDNINNINNNSSNINNNNSSMAAAAMKQLAFLHWEEQVPSVSVAGDHTPPPQHQHQHQHQTFSSSSSSATGLAWMKAAFAVGQDRQAAHELALVYEHGRYGTEIDIHQAVAWFRKAAAAGHVEAMAELGLCYELGLADIVPQSDELALEWYLQAANAGHLTAKYAVGEAFEEARGVPQSDEEACLWYYKAAIEGDEDSRKALRRLEDIARIVLPGAVGKLLDA